jgi:hypothetical protein
LKFFWNLLLDLGAISDKVINKRLADKVGANSFFLNGGGAF